MTRVPDAELPDGFEVHPIVLALSLLRIGKLIIERPLPLRLRVEFGSISGSGLAPVALHFGYLREGSG